MFIANGLDCDFDLDRNLTLMVVLVSTASDSGTEHSLRSLRGVLVSLFVSTESLKRLNVGTVGLWRNVFESRYVCLINLESISELLYTPTSQVRNTSILPRDTQQQNDHLT